MALGANQAYNRVCVFCKVDPKQHNTQVFDLLRRRPGVTQSQLESDNDVVQTIEATMIGDIDRKLQAMATIGSEKKMKNIKE